MVEKNDYIKTYLKPQKLKSDYIKVTEKGEQPEHNEATEIIEEIAHNNESINDLKRIERLKKWAKKNLVGLCISNLYCWYFNNNHPGRS